MRKRIPIAGKFGSVSVDAQWLAGGMYAARLLTTVKRSAWLMTPAVTISSYRARPGNTGSPAASAEVQPAGRVALMLRFQMAPDPACHEVPPLTLAALHSS